MKSSQGLAELGLRHRWLLGLQILQGQLLPGLREEGARVLLADQLLRQPKSMDTLLESGFGAFGGQHSLRIHPPQIVYFGGQLPQLVAVVVDFLVFLNLQLPRL